MTFPTFKRLVLNHPMILSAGVCDRLTGQDTSPGSRQELLNQFTRWQKKGLLIQLRRGMYLLNTNDRRINPSRSYLATQMYTPSYVSLEYALGVYGLIPERVEDVTSITTKKTRRIVNELGTFSYQHVTPAVFKGFKAAKDDQALTYFIAEPEKAVLDFIYFQLARLRTPTDVSSNIFADSYRFQNTEWLKEKRILELAEPYPSPYMRPLAELFCQFRREEATA